MNNEDAKKLIVHFGKVAGLNLKDLSQSQVLTWVKSAQQLIDSSELDLKELAAFIKWAVTENTSDNPKYNSVAYIAQSRDQFATLMKHSENLLRSFTVRKVVSKKVAAATASNNAPLEPQIAAWLMEGPGVNQPVDGWESARQKLDAIKKNWYGSDWESQPDPDILWEEKHKHYLRTLRIIEDDYEII